MSELAEINRRAGIYSGKGGTSKGEPGNMVHSIAWGIVLKLFRAGLIRKCSKSPGRSGYEPTEQASVRMSAGGERSWSVTIPGIAWSPCLAQSLTPHRPARPRGWARELASDAPDVAPEPWSADTATVGEAARVAQTLDDPRRG